MNIKKQRTGAALAVAIGKTIEYKIRRYDFKEWELEKETKVNSEFY